MANSQTLVFRVDASVAMGTGHVMRCLALAQVWQDAGGDVVFAMAGSTPAVEERLRSEGVEIVHLKTPASAHDAAPVADLAHARQANWVVVDGYEFGAEYQRFLKNSGLKVLFVDDNGHAAYYFADIVLNQNAHASEDLYASRESFTRLLLGPSYAMLRREFRPWRNWKREIAPIGHKVLVMMGGSDPNNITGRVINALRLVTVERLETTVVVGGSNPHVEFLTKATDQPGVFRFVRNPFNMPELMADADVAVSAAGTTCLEMCLLGLPAILIDAAANQTPVAQALEQKRLAIHVASAPDTGPAQIADKLQSLLSSHTVRAEMCHGGRELVDGRGAERVASAIRGGSLRLRKAEERDCRLLWEWANDPVVRALSFSPVPIPWEEHQSWFASKLNDRKCLIFIGENANARPIGQFRVEWRAGQEAEIDVSLAANSRGAGYGSALIDLAAQEVFATTPAERIHAFIRPDNQASRSAFELARFDKLGDEVVRGHAAAHYVRSRG